MTRAKIPAIIACLMCGGFAVPTVINELPPPPLNPLKLSARNSCLDLPPQTKWQNIQQIYNDPIVLCLSLLDQIDALDALIKQINKGK
jgi:hypothetical protein